MGALSAALSPANRATFFAATGGFASIVVGLSLLAVSQPAAFAFLALGLAIWALAGTADRWEGLALRLVGVGLEAKLAKKEHGEEFKEAAKSAPDSALEAVIPLLRQDVASDVLELGPGFDGKRLVDPELAWLRQELYVTVFAVQRPGDGDQWCGGGRISTMTLPAGTRLAVLGERADIDIARDRLAQ